MGQHTRHSMRPITLSRIIDLCLLGTSSDYITLEDVAKKLGTSNNRAKEITSELRKMNLLEERDEKLFATRNTRSFLDSFRSEDWDGFSRYFYRYHAVYRMFIDIMNDFISLDEGLAIDQILEHSKKKNLNLNRASIEVLANWSERIGVVQKNVFTGRFYLLDRKVPSYSVFRNTLKRCYDMLNSRQGFGLSQVYVEMPRLRECVCEILHFSRDEFDQMILRLYMNNISNMELAGAPMTTATKKSRYSIRKMMLPTDRKYDILSPKVDLERLRKGIEIHGKMYFYLAIHSKNLA